MRQDTVGERNSQYKVKELKHTSNYIQTSIKNNAETDNRDAETY